MEKESEGKSLWGLFVKRAPGLLFGGLCRPRPGPDPRLPLQFAGLVGSQCYLM